MKNQDPPFSLDIFIMILCLSFHETRLNAMTPMRQTSSHPPLKRAQNSKD